MKEIIKHLRALEAAATPGPWEMGSYDGRAVIHGPSIEQPVCPNSDIDFEVVGENEEIGEYGYVHDIRPPFRKKIDAKLCAEMRNALPALLDRLERLEAVAEAAGSLPALKYDDVDMTTEERRLKGALAALQEDK